MCNCISHLNEHLFTHLFVEVSKRDFTLLYSPVRGSVQERLHLVVLTCSWKCPRQTSPCCTHLFVEVSKTDFTLLYSPVRGSVQDRLHLVVLTCSWKCPRQTSPCCTHLFVEVSKTDFTLLYSAELVLSGAMWHRKALYLASTLVRTAQLVASLTATMSLSS